MSQQGKRKTKSLLDFYTWQKIESFLRTLWAFSILV